MGNFLPPGWLGDDEEHGRRPRLFQRRSFSDSLTGFPAPHKARETKRHVT